MIIRQLSEAQETERHVVTENWASTRLLLRNDGMGFSMHVTTIKAGTVTPMWYRHHLEAVLCIQGQGEIETDDGTVHSVRPGTLYALDRHDKHVLRATTVMKMVCVFNPPLHGKEVHDQNGVYPQTAEEIAS